MDLIQRITSDASQRQSLILYNGNVMSFEIIYSDSQQGWFITNLEYGSFIARGLRIVVSPNMLNQFKNLIDFGLGCFTNTRREPTLIQDFASKNFNLYILRKAEVDEYNQRLSEAKQNVSK